WSCTSNRSCTGAGRIFRRAWRSPWPPSMCWSSGTASSPTRRASCPSRSLNLVCKIPISLFSLSETNTIGFISSANCVEWIALGRQVREQVAVALGPAVPADDEAQTQESPVHVPLHPQVDPLAFGKLGMNGLERLVAQRAQPFPVFTKRLEHQRVHPGFGSDEKEAARLLHAPEVVKIDIAAIG